MFSFSIFSFHNSNSLKKMEIIRFFFYSKVSSSSIQYTNLYSKNLLCNTGYLKFKFSIPIFMNSSCLLQKQLGSVSCPDQRVLAALPGGQADQGQAVQT